MKRENWLYPQELLTSSSQTSQTGTSSAESATLPDLYLELMRRKCKKDLNLLMEDILGYRNLAPIHRQVTETLEKVEKGKRRGLFLLPRGHLKSTQITVSYTLQRILANPNVRILITNALLDNSKAFLREIKSHFEKNEKLKALFGDWTNQDEKWSESQVIVKKRTAFHKEPTVQITSVDKSVVSQHYDLIIADDLVTRESISTKEQRLKLIKYYKDLLDLLEPGGTLLVIGTRWHYDDLYGWLLSENVERSHFEVMVRKVIENGEPVFPQKFSLEYINQLKLEKGSYEFNSQYNNDPVSEDSADFKKEFIKWIPSIAIDPSKGQTYITVDPAVSKEAGSDFTGIVVNSLQGGQWKIIEARKAKFNPTELVDEMLYLYRKYKTSYRTMAIEDIMYTRAIDYDLTRRMQETGEWFSVEKVRHKNRRKEDRIRALIPLFERGNIELSDRCQDLEEELLRFPVGEHDDILDALAYQLDIVRPTENFTQTEQNKDVLFRMPIFPKY